MTKKHSNLVGSCPVVEVDMGGIKVSCLLDTGSMVTTICESFFKRHFQSWDDRQLQKCNWLQLRAANGLEIPYLGYLELDITVLGKVIPGMGVLVVRDHPYSGSVAKAPGLLGMNTAYLRQQQQQKTADT